MDKNEIFWQSLLCGRPSCMEQSTSSSSWSWQLVICICSSASSKHICLLYVLMTDYLFLQTFVVHSRSGAKSRGYDNLHLLTYLWLRHKWVVKSLFSLPVTVAKCPAAGFCLADQARCPLEHDCYPRMYRCDGYWDCPLRGRDEFNCRKLFPL